MSKGYLDAKQQALVAAIAAVIVGGVIISHPPPEPRGPEIPPTEFSAARAFSDVVALTALGPRPSPKVGEQAVPAHEQGRDLVIRRLKELGLTPLSQDGSACTPRGSCGQVRNILAFFDPHAPDAGDASRPGAAAAVGGAGDSDAAAAAAAGAEPAVMLLAHYDSVPAGPGAGDDAAGVASVFEIVRALRQSGGLRRPLLVVTDDGEERGLFGARVFCKSPWLQRVAVVLNFEARGNGGQTAMFETSEKSAWLVELYGNAVSRPVASSVIYSLYRTLPNDTDLTITKAAGLRGLNFAFADRVWNYHTPSDNADNLDRGSLQHMGDQGLAAARALLTRPELPTVDADAVWFDLFTLKLVLYRAVWAKAMAVLQALLLAAVMLVLLRRERAYGWVLLQGAARGIVMLALALAMGFIVSKLVVLLSGQPRPWHSRPLPTWLALVFGAAGAAMGGSALIDRLRPPRFLMVVYGTAAGGLALWTIPSLLLSFRVPGASYVFTLPALCGSAALLFAVLRTDFNEALNAPSSRGASWSALLVLLLSAATGFFLWVALLRVLLVMIGANLHQAVTVPVSLMVMLADPLLRLFPARMRLLLPLDFLIPAAVFVSLAVR